MIEHIEGAEKAVAECARVTRENMIVSVPNAAVIPHLWPSVVVPWHMLEASHVNFFTVRSLEALLRRSFAEVVVGYYARSFGFPNAPPLYAHLFAVAAHRAEGLRSAGGGEPGLADHHRRRRSPLSVGAVTNRVAPRRQAGWGTAA